MTRDALIDAHLDHVRGMAGKLKQRLPPFIDKDDLIQAGYVGLIESADRYRPGPVPFWAFAYRRVYGAMVESFRVRRAEPQVLSLESLTGFEPVSWQWWYYQPGPITCQRGHLYTRATAIIDRYGARRCRVCKNARERKAA